MSYSCTISFKTINADEIYSFFQQVKKACIDNIESFAQENYAFSPPFKRCSWKPIEIDYTEEFCELEKSIETWANYEGDLGEAIAELKKKYTDCR